MGNICNKQTLNIVDEQLQKTSTKKSKGCSILGSEDSNIIKLNKFIITVAINKKRYIIVIYTMSWIPALCHSQIYKK